jgi:serine/threonine protein phosphatase PrpC
LTIRPALGKSAPEGAGLAVPRREVRHSDHADGSTDIGQRRELNEDSFHCSEREGFCVLADGMGGRDYGEVASSLTVSTLNKQVKKHLPESYRRRRGTDDPELPGMLVDLFDRWIRDINKAVYDFGGRGSPYGEMGTTVAFAFFLDSLGILGHVGDSRIYRIRDGRSEMLTEDHSFVNAQLKARLITEEEALVSRHRNIIIRAIGTRPDVKADFVTLTVLPGDVFLLCSDGLSDLVEEDTMAALVRRADDDEAAVGSLIDLANERGGKDNITVIIARAEEGNGV